MNTTRNGKIARLPEAVREELNRRLDDGWMGKELVKWLKSLPEVQAVMAGEFEGRAVSEMNLSGWRKGGFGEWCRRQEMENIMRRISERRQAGRDADAMVW